MSAARPLFERVESGKRPSITDARPSAIAPAQQTILSLLTKAGADWNLLPPAAPALLYPLQSVGTTDVKADKTLLSIFLTDSLYGQPRIELLEKEVPVKIILFEDIISLERSDQINTLKLIYMYDETKVLKRNRSLTNIPNEAHTYQPTGKPLLLTLSFSSVKDAVEVMFAVNYLKSAPVSRFSLSPIIYHKGWCQKNRGGMSLGGLSWCNRYLRLMENRLLVYRTATSEIPVNVFALSGAEDAKDRVIVEAQGEKELVVLNAGLSFVPQGKQRKFAGSDRNALLFRFESVEIRDRWIAALAVEQRKEAHLDIKMLVTGQGAGLSSLAIAVPNSTNQSNQPTECHTPSSISMKRSSAPATVHRTSASELGYDTPVELTWLNDVDSLLSFVKDSQSFLSMIVETLRSNKLLHSNTLPSVNEWKSSTPDTLIRRRGDHMFAIDNALRSYHQVTQASARLLQTCHLVCFDVDGATGGATNQIAFSFPGFNSAVYDVGRVAVVSAWNLFEQSAYAYVEDDLKNALSSKSCTKELMQSSCDVSHLFDTSPEEAKLLLYNAQCEVLRNIILASYIRAKSSGTNSVNNAAHGVEEGDAIPWTNIITHFDDPSHPHAASSNNETQLSSLMGITYRYQPDRKQLNSLLHELVKNYTFSTDAHGTVLITSISSSPTSSSHASATDSTTSPKQSNSLPSPADSSKPTSPSSANTPSSPSSSADVGTSHETCLLCDNLRFLMLLRMLCEERRLSLVPLTLACHSYITHTMEKQKSKQQRFDTVTILESKVALEAKALENLANELPRWEVLERALTKQQKKASANILSNFLLSRPPAVSLSKKNIIPSKEEEEGQSNNPIQDKPSASRIERKRSIIESHLLNRQAKNEAKTATN